LLLKHERDAMSESKYSKYVISERLFDSRDAALPPGVDPESMSNTASHRKLMSLDDVVLKGSSYCEVVWMWPGGEDVYPETPEPISHAHGYDEILGFFGTDFKDPYDLGGEVELWIEDEKFLLTRTSLIFIPKGTYHCPLVIHRVDRPIFHFSTGPGGAYKQELAEK
jgi:hypothetical protein